MKLRKKNTNKDGQHLSYEELQDLNTFLNSDKTPEGCMDIFELDGFLTSIIIGPETIMPSQWLPVIWWATEDDEMKFDSTENIDHYITLIMRHYSYITDIFNKNPKEFTPLLGKIYEEGKEDVLVLDNWCWGFLQAVYRGLDAWNALIEDEKDSSLMTTIFTFGTEDGRAELKNNPGIKNVPTDRWEEMLYFSIHAIYEYWLPYRKAEFEIKKEKVRPMVGRNAPCPCGSGKKFKRCCGTRV